MMLFGIIGRSKCLMPRIPTLVPNGYGDVCEKNQQKFGVFFDLYYLCKRIQYLNSLQGSKQ